LFDVIVTDNMFGDIITDLGAMVQGAWASRRAQHQSTAAEHVSDWRQRAEIHRGRE